MKIPNNIMNRYKYIKTDNNSYKNLCIYINELYTRNFLIEKLINKKELDKVNLIIDSLKKNNKFSNEE